MQGLVDYGEDLAFAVSEVGAMRSSERRGDLS